jgi:SAM-dependent methyltransferase
MSELHDRIRDFWDRDAETYDRSPTHAASDPVEAAAWRAALRRHLPAPGAAILDAGAGTGSISLLLAELGYRVTALDLSPEMLARARAKAEELGVELELVEGRPRSRRPVRSTEWWSATCCGRTPSRSGRSRHGGQSPPPAGPSCCSRGSQVGPG